MIRAVSNKALYLTNHEYDYAKALQSEFGSDVFNNIFESDSDGNILLIKPDLNRNTPMAVIFFMLNVMMNQKLRVIDSFSDRINDISMRLSNIEEVVDG